MPTPRKVIPDGCNMGVLLRVIGIVVALSMAAAAADAASPASALEQFLRITSIAAPATLATLMFWCAARRGLPALSGAAAARDCVADSGPGDLSCWRC